MRTAVLITIAKLGAKPAVQLREDVVQAKADFKAAVAAGQGAELWLSDGGRVRRKALRPHVPKPPKGKSFAEGQEEILKQGAKADQLAADKEAAAASGAANPAPQAPAQPPGQRRARGQSKKE